MPTRQLNIPFLTFSSPIIDTAVIVLLCFRLLTAFYDFKAVTRGISSHPAVRLLFTIFIFLTVFLKYSLEFLEAFQKKDSRAPMLVIVVFLLGQGLINFIMLMFTISEIQVAAKKLLLMRGIILAELDRQQQEEVANKADDGVIMKEEEEKKSTIEPEELRDASLSSEEVSVLLKTSLYPEVLGRCLRKRQMEKYEAQEPEPSFYALSEEDDDEEEEEEEDEDDVEKKLYVSSKKKKKKKAAIITTTTPTTKVERLKFGLRWIYFLLVNCLTPKTVIPYKGPWEINFDSFCVHAECVGLMLGKTFYNMYFIKAISRHSDNRLPNDEAVLFSIITLIEFIIFFVIPYVVLKVNSSKYALFEIVKKLFAVPLLLVVIQFAVIFELVNRGPRYVQAETVSVIVFFAFLIAFTASLLLKHGFEPESWKPSIITKKSLRVALQQQQQQQNVKTKKAVAATSAVIKKKKKKNIGQNEQAVLLVEGVQYY